MALNSPLINSSCGEQRWVDHMSRIFYKEVVIDINEDGACIFQVPKSISAFKPDAYIPQVLALGPYHHVRPELYHMQCHKIAAAKRGLKPDQILNFQHLMIDELKEFEPTIRVCYQKYLDLDHCTLAWILAIDGLFLIQFLCTDMMGNQDYSAGKNSILENEISGNQDDSAGKNNLTQDAIIRDVMMLENQIPVILLKKIQRTLRLSSFDDEGFFEMLKGFCKRHSPLELEESFSVAFRPRYLPLEMAEAEPSSPIVKTVHLLDLMYYLIVNKEAPLLPLGRAGHKRISRTLTSSEIMKNGMQIIRVLASLSISGAEGILKPFMVIANFPWDMISGLVGNLKGSNSGTEADQTPQVEKIHIPSVSQISNVAKISFGVAVDGGIRDIEFNKLKYEFKLPVITLNDTSEVILRNLVAYEALSAKPGITLELAQYVDLMSGIIHDTEDVKLLRDKNIIRGSLTDEAIADLFNGMNRSTGKPSEQKSKLEKTIDEVNEYFDKNPKVKLRKLLKKLWYASLKFLSVFSTIALVLLLALQAVCQVYGCSRFW